MSFPILRRSPCLCRYYLTHFYVAVFFAISSCLMSLFLGHNFTLTRPRRWTFHSAYQFFLFSVTKEPRLDKTLSIGHFRVPPGLCIKTRLGAQPLIWKWFFILMQIKLISTRKVKHLTSFWYRGPGELENGLLSSSFLMGSLASLSFLNACIFYLINFYFGEITKLNWTTAPENPSFCLPPTDQLLILYTRVP